MADSLKELLEEARDGLRNFSYGPGAAMVGRLFRALMEATETGQAPRSSQPTINLADALSAPSADIERLEEAYYDLFRTAPGTESWAMSGNPSFEKVAAIFRSAISSQTSPQGKQGVRTELARLGSQEATPNTGVKLEGGGG